MSPSVKPRTIVNWNTYYTAHYNSKMVGNCTRRYLSKIAYKNSYKKITMRYNLTHYLRSIFLCLILLPPNSF